MFATEVIKKKYKMFATEVIKKLTTKCKYLKKFEYNFCRSPECEFAEYIRNNINEQKIKEVEQLYLECCFAGDLSILHV